jgi:hypothetical protein
MKKAVYFVFLLFLPVVMAGCSSENQQVYPWADLSSGTTIDTAGVLEDINGLAAWFDPSIYDGQMELSTQTRNTRSITDATGDSSDRAKEQAVLDWVLGEEKLTVMARIDGTYYSAHSFDALQSILDDLGVSDTDKYIVVWDVDDRYDLVTGEFMAGTGTGFGIDTIGFKPAILDWDTDMSRIYADADHQDVHDRFGDDQIITVFFTRTLPRYQQIGDFYQQELNGLWVSARNGAVYYIFEMYKVEINDDGYAVISKRLGGNGEELETPLAGTVTDYVGVEQHQ